MASKLSALLLALIDLGGSTNGVVPLSRSINRTHGWVGLGRDLIMVKFEPPRAPDGARIGQF